MSKTTKVKCCRNCGSTELTRDLTSSSGDLSCSACGSVQEENPIVSEVQFGEASNGAAMVQGAMVGSDQTRAFNSRTSLESREQTIMNAKQKIRTIAGVMRIPDYIVESACGWFKLALVQNFVQGRRSQNVIAACLYVACRHEKTHHLLIDFSSRLQISVYSLGATYLKLVRALQIQRLPLADPSLFIQHFAERLNFGDYTAKVCRDATKIASRMASDWIYEGRRPAGIAGACLLLAARMNNFRRSHAEIVAVARVGEETLQKRLNEFKSTKSATLSVSEFRESSGVDDTSKPPSYTKNRRIEKKIERLMKQRRETLETYRKLAKDRVLFKELDILSENGSIKSELMADEDTDTEQEEEITKDGSSAADKANSQDNAGESSAEESAPEDGQSSSSKKKKSSTPKAEIKVEKLSNNVSETPASDIEGPATNETVETSYAENSEETSQIAVASEQTDPPAEASQETSPPAEASEETSQTVEASEETVQTADASEESSQSVEASQETSQSAEASQETSQTAEASEETSQTAESAETSEEAQPNEAESAESEPVESTGANGTEDNEESEEESSSKTGPEVNDLFVPSDDENGTGNSKDAADPDFESQNEKIGVKTRNLRSRTAQKEHAKHLQVGRDLVSTENATKKTGRLEGIDDDGPGAGRRSRTRKEGKVTGRSRATKKTRQPKETKETKEMIAKRKKTEQRESRQNELMKAVLLGGELTEEDLEIALDRLLEGHQKTLNESLYKTPADSSAADDDIARRIELDRPRNLVKNNPTTSEILSRVPDDELINSDEDDDEVESIRLGEEERLQKEQIWIALNHDFLIEQEKKRLKIEADELTGNTSGQTKKRRKNRERKDAVLNDSAVTNAIHSIGEGGKILTPAESTKQMLQKKPFSKKINYDSIGELFTE